MKVEVISETCLVVHRLLLCFVTNLNNTSYVREASHIDFVHEKRHMDVPLKTPPP